MARAFPAAAWVFVVLICAVPCEAAWHRLDSPNFVVVGDASPRQLRDVAVKFEAFREILGRLRGNEIATAAVPTVILVFRSDKAFTPYKPRFNGKPVELTGLFVRDRDVNHIALVTGADVDGERIMYHEYAHLIISNGLRNVPVWLNEGLAELYSTFELTRDGREVLIGRPIGSHLALLNHERLLKLPELLQVNHSSPLYNEGERRSVFYAQSWALMHMISFGEPPRTKQLSLYMQRLSEGMPPTEAWAQAFGSDRLDRELERYVRRASYRAIQHRFSEKLTTFNGEATPLPQAEVHGFLAHFLLRQERFDEATAQLASGSKLDEQNALLRVLSAHVDVSRDEHAKAVQRLLPMTEPGDWLAAYLAGVALSEAAASADDARAEVRTLAARFFDAAVRGRQFPNAVIRRASLDTIVPDAEPTAETVAAVERARSAAPGREDYAFVHAQLLALRSDFKAARDVAGPLLASQDQPAIREAARSLMKWIVEMEKFHAARASAAKGESPPPAAAGTSGAAPEPDGQLRAVFRETQPGEERLEGVLQRIDCTAGGATFVLQAGEGVVRMAATKMGDVEFITYRDDLSGTISCGPLKEPMRVYVTSRAPSKQNGPREVVAVEFLPKEMR